VLAFTADVRGKIDFPCTVPLLPFAVEEVLLPGTALPLGPQAHASNCRMPCFVMLCLAQQQQSNSFSTSSSIASARARTLARWGIAI
jgi:hypothetical protein